MGEQLGDEAGDDFKEMVDQLEAGEMPDDPGGPGGDDDFGAGFGAGAGGASGSDPFD
jgi:hypothetical protein